MKNRIKEQQFNLYAERTPRQPLGPHQHRSAARAAAKDEESVTAFATR